MEPITQAEYFTQCHAIAVECAKEAKGDLDVAHEAIHTALDGHQWIISTYYSLQVLTHSRNENAFFDAVGGSLGTESFSDTMLKLALWAMSADVYEYLEAALTGYATAQESEAV